MQEFPNFVFLKSSWVLEIKFFNGICHAGPGIWFIICTFFCTEARQTVSAQDPITASSPRIEWIDEYPMPDSDKENHRKKGKFIDIILGRKNTVEMIRPVNIAATNKDEYWVLDQANGKIFQINQEVGDIPHIRNKKFNHFPSLVGLCFFGRDRMLLTDSYLNRIFVYNPGEKEISPLNDTLTLNQPTGVAYSSATHEIWVVETKDHSVSVLSDEGIRKKHLGKRGNEPGEFNYPTSIWIDKTGNAYIVDALNFRIQVFNKDGELISVFGKNGDGGGNLARPKGVATDSFGHIYIVDALFNAVQIFDISGKFLYSFGTMGQGKGEFWMPSGIFVDERDFIYVADCYNSRVQIFRLIN